MKRLMVMLAFCLFISANVLARDTRTTTGHLYEFEPNTFTELVSDVRGDYLVTASCITNGSYREGRKNILLVHGLCHDGDGWEMTAGLLADTFNDSVFRVCAVDMPGHGSSGWPERALLGNIGIDDYVRSIQVMTGAIVAYDELDDGELVLVGHSLGGMVIQATQQKLFEQNSSLYYEYGIDDVVLIAPTLPEDVLWTTVYSVDVFSTLLKGLTFSSQGCLGESTKYEDWLELFFIDSTTGNLYTTLPSQQTVQYINSSEPCTAVMQMLGIDTNPGRPEISAGIFAPTNLKIVSFSRDQYVSTSELTALYSHLVGDNTGGIVTIDAPHDGIYTVPVVNPDALVSVFSSL